MLCSELIESVYGGDQVSALSGYEACVSLLVGDCGLQFGLQTGKWSQTCRIHRFKLGRVCISQEKHFKVLLWVGLVRCVVVQWKAKVGGFEPC